MTPDEILASVEPVACIGKDWRLLWASAETLSSTVNRTGAKIGDNLYTRAQVLAMMAQVVEVCVKACEAERLPDQRGGIRMAYDAAIEHCVEAIRATLPTAPIGDRP